LREQLAQHLHSSKPKGYPPTPSPGGTCRNFGRLVVGLALILCFGTASATPLCLRRWIVPLLLDHILWNLGKPSKIRPTVSSRQNIPAV